MSHDTINLSPTQNFITDRSKAVNSLWYFLLKYSIVFHLQMFVCLFFLLQVMYTKLKIYSVKFRGQSCRLSGKGLPVMLAICSFCGCFIIFLCLFFSF